MAEKPAIQLLRVEIGGMTTAADDEQVRFASDIITKTLEGNGGRHVKVAEPSA